MTAPDFRCDRCDAPLPAIEITRFGDKEPRYLPGMGCNCPGPRCPCCNTRLDDGYCTSLLDCPVGGCVIPVPVIA